MTRNVHDEDIKGSQSGGGGTTGMSGKRGTEDGRVKVFIISYSPPLLRSAGRLTKRFLRLETPPRSIPSQCPWPALENSSLVAP